MWTRAALLEALGKPNAEWHEQSVENSGRNLARMRWDCPDGAIVAEANLDGLSTLKVNCSDARHQELKLMEQAQAHDVRVVDNATGQKRTTVPRALSGATVQFELETPVPVHVRVEVQLDPEHQFRAVEQFDVGLHGPGSHAISVPLSIDQSGPGKHDGPAKLGVEIRIEIVDPKTGERDWATDGILLYSHQFPAS